MVGRVRSSHVSSPDGYSETSASFAFQDEHHPCPHTVHFLCVHRIVVNQSHTYMVDEIVFGDSHYISHCINDHRLIQIYRNNHN